MDELSGQEHTGPGRGGGAPAPGLLRAGKTRRHLEQGGWPGNVRAKASKSLLPELVSLQGGLQKGGGLYLAFGYQVCDVVTEKNFRTH
jgi:hypothetical protein